MILDLSFTSGNERAHHIVAASEVRVADRVIDRPLCVGPEILETKISVEGSYELLASRRLMRGQNQGVRRVVGVPEFVGHSDRRPIMLSRSIVSATDPPDNNPERLLWLRDIHP